MHLKGALRNGVTRAEIREVLLQVAIYGGIPAGVDSFRIAREVFDGVDAAAARE
jgi:4-carboxymuconolactone decarboxylase